MSDEDVRLIRESLDYELRCEVQHAGPEAGAHLRTALAALDSLTSELHVALASNQIQYEAANKAEAELAKVREERDLLAKEIAMVERTANPTPPGG